MAWPGQVIKLSTKGAIFSYVKEYCFGLAILAEGALVTLCSRFWQHFHMGIWWHLYETEQDLKSVIKLNKGIYRQSSVKIPPIKNTSTNNTLQPYCSLLIHKLCTMLISLLQGICLAILLMIKRWWFKLDFKVWKSESEVFSHQIISELWISLLWNKYQSTI